MISIKCGLHSLLSLLALVTSVASANRPAHAEDLSYHTYESMLAELRLVEKEHAQICKLHDLGVSSDGHTHIWALKVSDHVEQEEDEPNVLLTGCIHGNERPPLEAALYTIKHLVSEKSCRTLIEKTQIWVIPILNPAGHQANSRYNANGVDLNRGFPSDWENDNVEGLQIETRNLVNNFFLRHPHVVAGIDLHTFGQVYLLPWARSRKKPADWNALKDLGDQMAKTSGYRVLQLTDFIRRTVSGGGADYRYGRFGTFYYGLELGRSHAPPAKQLAPLLRKNLAGIMLMMNRVHASTLTGHVTRNGKPVVATVNVEGIDKPTNLRQPYRSDSTFGRYYRILLPGTYSITFTFGDEKIVKRDVPIVNDRQTVVDIDFP